MTRTIRPLLLTFLLILSILLIWQSLSYAQNDPAPPTTDVVATEEAPTAEPATKPTAEPAAEPALTTEPTPEVKPAAEKEESPALARLINMLIDILSAVLLILVPYFVHRLIAYFEKKTSLELADKHKDKINALLYKGLAFA